VQYGRVSACLPPLPCLSRISKILAQKSHNPKCFIIAAVITMHDPPKSVICYLELKPIMCSGSVCKVPCVNRICPFYKPEIILLNHHAVEDFLHKLPVQSVTVFRTPDPSCWPFSKGIPAHPVTMIVISYASDNHYTTFHIFKKI